MSRRQSRQLRCLISRTPFQWTANHYSILRSRNRMTLFRQIVRKRCTMGETNLREGRGQTFPANSPIQQVELPLTVRDAALYLGVSTQTVYLWVERKQIPHLRVMGRNIRFLKSDLETFRASFKQEMENE